MVSAVLSKGSLFPRPLPEGLPDRPRAPLRRHRHIPLRRPHVRVPGELGDDLEALAAVGEQRAEGVAQDVRRAPVLGQAGALGVAADDLVERPRD